MSIEINHFFITREAEEELDRKLKPIHDMVEKESYPLNELAHKVSLFIAKKTDEMYVGVYELMAEEIAKTEKPLVKKYQKAQRLVFEELMKKKSNRSKKRK